MSKPTKQDLNISIKELSKDSDTNNSFKQQHLTLEILLNNNINISDVNGLRRTALDYVPTYAFCPKTIIVEENTSLYDNDQIRNRLEQITPQNIINNIIILDSKYWQNTR